MVRSVMFAVHPCVHSDCKSAVVYRTGFSPALMMQLQQQQQQQGGHGMMMTASPFGTMSTPTSNSRPTFNTDHPGAAAGMLFSNGGPYMPATGFSHALPNLAAAYSNYLPGGLSSDLSRQNPAFNPMAGRMALQSYTVTSQPPASNVSTTAAATIST